MQVKLTFLVHGAYCNMRCDESPGFSQDVLLPSNMRPEDSLLQRAQEYEREAARMSKYAARCREAASQLACATS